MGKGDAGRYENFGDPVGLIGRMIASRNRAAYASLARAAMASITRVRDGARVRSERAIIDDAQPCDRPILLVTGGARTGTTVTTSLLAGLLEVDWFDNLSDLYPRSPLATTQLTAQKRRSAGSLESFYGKTRELHAPSDAFEVWNRWFGHDRYRPTPPDDSATVAEMRKFFDAWCVVSPHPLINKNNRNLSVIDALIDILPQARFAVLVRSPMPTVASILRARRLVHGDERAAWGVFATSARADASPLGYIDDICHQVVDSITTARRASARHGDRVQIVDYEKTMADPSAVAKEVATRFGLRMRPSARPPALTATDTTTYLTDAERTRAMRTLAELGFW